MNWMSPDSRLPRQPTPHEASRGGFFLNVMPALLYVVAVFYGGSVAQPPMPDVRIMPADKLMHCLGFAGMQITMVRALRYELPRLSYKQHLWVALIACSALGAALELFQAMLPARTADLVDWVADTVGAGTAAGAMWLLFGRGGTPRD